MAAPVSVIHAEVRAIDMRDGLTVQRVVTVDASVALTDATWTRALSSVTGVPEQHLDVRAIIHLP
jgi:hypothetical protein